MITYKCRDAVAINIHYPIARVHFTLAVALKYYTTRKNMCAYYLLSQQKRGNYI